jgi:uncharacterized membrane protein
MFYRIDSRWTFFHLTDHWFSSSYFLSGQLIYHVLQNRFKMNFLPFNRSSILFALLRVGNEYTMFHRSLSIWTFFHLTVYHLMYSLLWVDKQYTMLHRIHSIEMISILLLEKIKDPFLQGHCLATSYSHRGNAPTTIGAEELNFRVRNGNGCILFAIITKLIRDCSLKTR